MFESFTLLSVCQFVSTWSDVKQKIKSERNKNFPFSTQQWYNFNQIRSIRRLNQNCENSRARIDLCILHEIDSVSLLHQPSVYLFQVNDEEMSINLSQK